MKKILKTLLIILLPLIITLLIFDNFSLYNFGDIPTTIVLKRLIISYLTILTALIALPILYKRRKKCIK